MRGRGSSRRQRASRNPDLLSALSVTVRALSCSLCARSACSCISCLASSSSRFDSVKLRKTSLGCHASSTSKTTPNGCELGSTKTGPSCGLETQAARKERGYALTLVMTPIISPIPNMVLLCWWVGLSLVDAATRGTERGRLDARATVDIEAIWVSLVRIHECHRCTSCACRSRIMCRMACSE